MQIAYFLRYFKNAPAPNSDASVTSTADLFWCKPIQLGLSVMSLIGRCKLFPHPPVHCHISNDGAENGAGDRVGDIKVD